MVSVMENDKIKEEIFNIVSQTIGKNNFCVSNNEYIGHIDSLDFVKILLEIEMKYNVEFQEEDLIRSNYCYLDNLVDTVKKMVNNDEI